ncbi:SGNH/GDSL hydrolase family protein [Paraburkholderia sp. J7]|uniref:SGNH/GDSL hydrolase family protein n=1 Tax=Paraburkholderia sp. J7 TaxID=2805438 RepID=UPI002AB5F142|nr:SGNH/GDSL hydrolase family protein [Paraburkholderia sp. J7]
MKRCHLQVLASFTVFASAAAYSSEFYLHAGDTVVFLGDSITEGGAYTTTVEDYVVTRFPEMRVRFVNSGVGRDTIRGGLAGSIDERLIRDVAPFHPNVVSMMFGMNDAHFHPYDQTGYDTYLAGYQTAMTTLRKLAPDTRITVIRPSPYDDVTRPALWGSGYNDVLVRYGEGLSSIAKDSRAEVVDLNGPVVKDLRRLTEIDPENARRLIPDRIHPVAAGGLLFAKALLKAWYAKAVVSSVSIHVGSHPTWVSNDAQVRNLQSERGLSWESLDRTLPMPLPDDDLTKFVVEHTDILESLSEQRLVVSGLPSQRYRLSIDNQVIAVFDADALAQGINLAAYPTPMTAQAADVHRLTLAHNAIRATRWRRVQMLKTTEHSDQLKSALDALDLAEDQVIALQLSAALPVWHRFELAPL